MSYTDTYMALTWSERRRTGIIAGFAIVLLLAVAGIAFAVMYEVPSCMDGKQNADESGVDCGGSCAYLCKADVEAPRVSFVRAVANGGRTDVIAYVENRNRDAEAKSARYAVEVFDEAGSLLGKKEETIDLPPRAVVPIFVPGILPGIGAAPRAFVSFDDAIRWRTPGEGEAAYAATEVSLILGEQPRVTAKIGNASAAASYGRTAVATVFGADGQAIAASKTVVRQIPAFGTADAVFTWPEPFAGTPVRVEVIVVPVLP
jgi:hypothetical protein